MRPERKQVIERYGKLPLGFEANRGQTDPRVKFLSRGRGYNLFLTPTEAVLALHKPESQDSRRTGEPVAASERPAQIENPVVLRMKLLGANRTAEVSGMQELPGKSNYLIGNDPKKWRTDVPNFARVQYRNVYPGIDLLYYGNQGQLENDFVVSPGADPKAIDLGFRGEAKMEVDAQGELLLHVADGQIVLHKPVAYQLSGGARQEVSAGYEIKRGKEVRFVVANYNPAIPLVIDPVLSYSTYLGGSSGDSPAAIAVDTSGNAYVVGRTESTDYPVTAGAFQTASGGVEDAFVTKLNSTGTALVYSTYLGGSLLDFAQAVAVNSSGNAYLAGAAKSSNFPVTAGAFQTTKVTSAGLTAAFITELNAAGNGLVYSTYLTGTNQFSQANAIALDSSGNAYVTGIDLASDFPTTPGAFSTTMHAIFVTELNPTGTALVYSTFLGGSQNTEDSSSAIAVDSSGNAYVTGSAYSSDFPVTPGVFQTTKGTNAVLNAFVTKFNSTGTALIYSTYLGGSFADNAAGIAIDSSGNAYVTGQADSTDFPVTVGSFQTVYAGGNNDAFVSKLNATGTALVYSTYLGGSDTDAANGIAVDSSGNAYVTGLTDSSNFPTTGDAYQAAYAGSGDAFLTEINTAGTGLVYSTYLGGASFDHGFGIALDSTGAIYLTGSAGSNFPVANGAFQTSLGSAISAPFVAKFSSAVGSAGTHLSVSPVTATYGGTANLQAVLTRTSDNTGLNSEAVSFTLNSSPAGSGMTNSSGTATVTAASLSGIAAGTYPTGVAASFSGDITYAAASGSAQLKINPAPLTITANNLSRPYGAPNPPLTASYSAFASGDGQSVLSGSLSCTTTAFSGSGASNPGSAPGTYPIICSGQSSTNYTITYVRGTLTITSAPLVKLSLLGVTFPSQIVDTSSSQQSVTLTNSGKAALNISGISATGDFSQTNNCKSSIAAKGTCSIKIRFFPTAAGTRTGSIIISDDAYDSPQQISLEGVGIAASISPAKLTFAARKVGTTSPPQSVDLLNNGAAILAIYGISITGANSADFSQNNNCSTSVNGSAFCVITVTFTPHGTGTRKATLQIVDSDPSSPQSVALSGTGK